MLVMLNSLVLMEDILLCEILIKQNISDKTFYTCVTHAQN